MPFQSTNHPRRDIDHLWGIVLAGGDGKRLEMFVRSRFGRCIPKQYCAFTGTRSMLAHTLSRVELLVRHQNIIVTIKREQIGFAQDCLKEISQNNIVIQPISRETGVGILHALLHICQRDPQALVAVFPSDHFILEEERFMECVYEGVVFVRLQRHQLLLLGVEPDQPDSEYGWIEPGIITATVGASEIKGVKCFLEKPAPEHTIRLYRNRCLWNTLVLVGFANTLLHRFRQLTPEIAFPMLSLQKHFCSSTEHERAKTVYEQLPSVNFSKGILEGNSEGLSVLCVKNVYWSDWGIAQRIEKDIAHLSIYRKQQGQSIITPAAKPLAVVATDCRGFA